MVLMKTISPERAKELAAYIRSHWGYNPDTGVVTGRGGKPIGTRRRDGALQALAYLPSGTTAVLLHRAAWLLATGRWPTAEVDHRDGNRRNNRWRNLREATRAENQQNRRQRGAAGNLIGCSRYYRKWKAQIRHEGRVHYLGLFDTEQEAHAAYCEAKQRLHTFNPEQRQT